MTNPVDLAAIRARADSATPGPWIWEEEDETTLAIVAIGSAGSGPFAWLSADRRADAEWITRARDDVPDLLGRVDAVIALHHEDQVDYHDGEGNHLALVCAECGADLDADENATGCPTVRTILGLSR